VEDDLEVNVVETESMLEEVVCCYGDSTVVLKKEKSRVNYSLLVMWHQQCNHLLFSVIAIDRRLEYNLL